MVEPYNWYVHTSGYVRTSIYNQTDKTIYQIQLHRLVTHASDDVFIDHISGVRYDDRKCNLRLANYSTNMMNSGTSIRNTSGTRGVDFSKYTGKWRARIQVNNKRISLGEFDNIQDAIHARKQAEEKYYGDYAYRTQ